MSVLAGVLGAAAHAEDAPAPTSEAGGGNPLISEVVVTATRRSTAESKVPQSIVAYDQRALDAQSVRGLDDLTTLTPGLDLTRNAEGNGTLVNISIRGIVSNSEAATTGVYIDDTPVQPRENGLSLFGSAIPAIFDLDRIEVLRGPQGTLFGAGAEGGALRFITEAPSLTTYSAYGRAEVAGTQNGGPSGEIGLAVGGPIVQDVLGFRVSGYYRHDGGYIDHVSYQTGQSEDKDSNYEDTTSFRAALTFTPNNWLKFTPSIYYQQQYVNDTSYYWESLSDPGNEVFKNGKQVQEPSLDIYYLPSLRVDANLGFASIVSATSYLNRHGSTIVDETNLDGSYLLGDPYITDPNEQAPEYDTAAINTITQEIRIQSNPGRFQWVVGGFYSQTGDTEHQAGVATPFAAVIDEELGVPLYEGQYFYLVTEHSTDSQIAGFADVSYEIIHGLRVSAGVRYADLKEHYTRQANGPLYGGNGTPTDAYLNYNLYTGNTATTPKFNISYQITDDYLVYATADEGTRIGGINRNAFPLPACLAAIAGLGLKQFPPSSNPDSLWNYEVGSKDQWFGGALRVEGAVFVDKWKNIQRQIAPNECGGSYFTGNLGNATSKGVEMSVYAQPIRDLSINLQASYTDAQFDTTLRSSGSEAYVTAGDTLGTPPWIIALTGRYQRPVSDTLKGYFQAQLEYRSHNNGHSEVQDPATISYDPNIPLPPAVTLVSLRSGVVFGGKDLSLFVTNLFDAHPEIARFHAFAGDPLYLGRTERPRTVGMTVTVHY